MNALLWSALLSRTKPSCTWGFRNTFQYWSRRPSWVNFKLVLNVLVIWSSESFYILAHLIAFRLKIEVNCSIEDRQAHGRIALTDAMAFSIVSKWMLVRGTYRYHSNHVQLHMYSILGNLLVRWASLPRDKTNNFNCISKHAVKWCWEVNTHRRAAHSQLVLLPRCVPNVNKSWND